jgi:tellurium resistance protein TerZ
MGLGWDPVPNNDPYSSTKEIDLDASCSMFDENKNSVGFVWFNMLKSQDGSIYHTGDNLTGEGEGDDEQIVVDLSKVPPKVKYLVFTVNSYSGQTFDELENAFCRLVDARNQKEIARFTLTNGGPHTAMIMAKVYRHQGEWKMHALGEPAEGQIVLDIVQDMVKIL